MQSQKRSITELFKQHPQSVGEGYFQHMQTSFRFGLKMLIAGSACFAHGICPFLCVTTGSRTISSLHHHMVSHRDSRQQAQSEIENSSNLSRL